MPKITKHSKERLVQRSKSVTNYADAKRIAKIAWNSGQTIGKYNIYPRFFAYLTNKRNQSSTCSIRIYQNNIYIWRGRNRSLVTAHPIPDRYLEEMKEVNSKNGHDNTGKSAGTSAGGEAVFP